MSENGDDQPDPTTEVLDPQDPGDAGSDADTAVPPKPAPEDPIRQAERELKKAQDKLTDAKDKAKRDEEVDKVLGQYEAVQVDLEADDTALIDHLNDTLTKLAATAKEKEKVRKAVEFLDTPITNLVAAIEADDTAIADRRAALAARVKERDEAKDAFESLKNQIKGIEARHAQANAVRKEIADARAKGQRLLAYYLLVHKLGPLTTAEPEPIELDEFTQKIRDKAASYGGLTRAVADLEAALKDDEAKLAADEKALADLRKAYDAALRAKLTA